MSPDGQFLAYTETPPGMTSSVIHVFSRKYGYVAALISAGPFPFRKIHFKQTPEATHVQAIDSYGIYLEWKLFGSPRDPGFSYKDVPKVNEWTESAYGAEGKSAANFSCFSDDGRQVLAPFHWGQ